MLALLLSLLSVAAAAPCCAPSTTDFNIKFAGANLCIDNTNGNTADGNPVQV